MQSAQVRAGVMTNFFDGPVEQARKGVNNLIINTMENLQKSMTELEENVNSVMRSSQQWVDKMRETVQNSLKDIMNRVSF